MERMSDRNINDDRGDIARLDTADRLPCRAACLVMIGSVLSAVAFPVSGVAADPWADEVISAAATLDGNEYYDDPFAILGPATTTFEDILTRQLSVVSMVKPAWGVHAKNEERLITTINPGQFIKLRFDEPILDDPQNPFGIDMIVFGNAFFPGYGFVPGGSQAGDYVLVGTLFQERVTVAVSPTGIGDPRTQPDQWFVYDSGPFADGLFPSNPFEWDRTASSWGRPQDPLLPVDPSLSLADFAGKTLANAVGLYQCSAGGTGFDLAESGFSSIQYVYLTGHGGEVDALVDVFPSLGDFDRDGDVDLRDLADFQNCYAPSFLSSFDCGCRSGDWDGSQTIDSFDFEYMSSHFDGP